MNQQNNSYVTLKGAWEIFINNIWLFAISMSVGVVIALAYITITPPTYKRTASILIKNEKSGSASGSDEMLLKDLGLAQSNTNLTNEILVLQNPLLMEEVVRRLGLNYNYSIHRKGLRWIDLYGSAPFKVELSEPLRESNISMLLSPRDSVSFTIAELIVDGQGVGDEIQGVYGKPIVTPYGAFTVVENMPLEGDAYGNLYSFSKESINGASSAYMRSLSVALRDEMASIVDISFVSGSTQKAEDVINTLISVYNENWIKDRNLATVSTTSFINDRLAIIERELGEVDRDISSYKSENLLPDVGVVTGINLQSSADILKEQVELNNQLSMAVYVVEYLENKGNSDSLLPVNTGIESPNIEQQISTYNELLLKKKNYLLNSSINNPIVKAIALEQKELKGLIMNSIKEYISAIKIRLEQSQMAEVAAQRRISNNPSQELYLLSSGRKQKIKEELYLFLLQKREENELSQAFVSYNTKVLNLARGSNVPIEPKRMEVLLLGLTLGFILPIIYLLLREAFDTQIKSRADLESL
ncbi:MAG: GNVR domain-containing protein, partial [Rikenellaceae bacterium]